MNYDSVTIEEKYIRKQDVATGGEIIKEMNPDILIMTMPCIKKKMNAKLKSLDYKILVEDASYGYDVFCKRSIETALCKPEWQEEIDQKFEDYILPEHSWELREFIQQIIKTSRFKSKSKLRKYIFQILVDKIQGSGNIS